MLLLDVQNRDLQASVEILPLLELRAPKQSCCCHHSGQMSPKAAHLCCPYPKSWRPPAMSTVWEPEAETSLLLLLCSISCLQFQRTELTRRHLGGECGKCSLQISNPRNPKQTIEGQIGNGRYLVKKQSKCQAEAMLFFLVNIKSGYH